jgi:dTDP-4-dehydrorhamnose reductase
MDLRNKKILVTGANGQLGYAIVNVFKQHNFNVIGTDRSMLDVTKPEQVSHVLKAHKPDVIIHCAAYTAVDKAESDRITCYKANVDGTRNLAQVAKELDIEFIYFSTDYVFDGTKQEPYETSDIPNPINYYGLTKYLAEEVVRTLLKKFYIFRISWVFGPNGKNFVNTILKLSKEQEIIKVVKDQIGSPTYTIDVANFLAIENEIYFGTHHLTNNGYISWFDFANEIVSQTKSKCNISPINSIEFNSVARRAKNSKLYSKIKMNNWKDSLRKYLNEI